MTRTPSLLLALDGGQTTTRCVLLTSEGRVLAQGTGSGLLHLSAEGGRAQCLTALREAVTDTWRNTGRMPHEVAAIGLGLTNVESADSPEAQIVHELLPQVVTAQQSVVQNDGVAALVGAHPARAGIIVIAGTGTITYGQDTQGRIARVGGWGWLLGDEGSAMAIGRDALIAAFHGYDGIGAPTMLTEAFVAHFGVSYMPAVKRLVYAPDFGARGFAALAPIVSHVAAQDDAVARAIITAAGQALAQSVCALRQPLNFDAIAAPIAPIGGAFSHVSGLQEAFVAHLQMLWPAAIVVEPELPPVLGAAVLALQACGVSIADAIERLREAKNIM